jgi:hypothetical protein
MRRIEPRVVDQGIDPAETLDHSRGYFFRLLRAGDVEP